MGSSLRRSSQPLQFFPASLRHKFFCDRGSLPHLVRLRVKYAHTASSKHAPVILRWMSYRFPEVQPGKGLVHLCSSSERVPPEIQAHVPLLCPVHNDLRPESFWHMQYLCVLYTYDPTAYPASFRYKYG